MAATDAKPVPQKNVAFRVGFPILKNDGTLITSWTGADSEISKDGGNYADCTSEATEIQTSGTGFLDLTASEMNADMVIVKITVTNTGALPVMLFLYPEEAGDIRVNLTQWLGIAPLALTSQEVNTNDTDVLAAIALLDAAGVDVIAPVDAVTANVSVIRGDTYAASESRRLEWTSADWTPYDLSTATLIQFRAKSLYDDTIFTKTATAASDSLVQCALTSTETETFPVGRNAMRYDLQATLASGSIVTLASGKVNVAEDVR